MTLMTRRPATRDDRAAAFAALGDPTRLSIADLLTDSDLTPGEIVDRTGHSSPLIAHHLDVLEAAGIVWRTPSEADRRKRFVVLRSEWRGVLAPVSTPRDVVFVCTHNSARSQMAAAIWRDRVGGRASSAGTAPATRIHPSAVRVAKRRGLDLASSVPTLFTPDHAPHATVITVCDRAHDDLVGESTNRLHWSIPDPVRTGGDGGFERAFQMLEDRISGVASVGATPLHLMYHQNHERTMP